MSQAISYKQAAQAAIVAIAVAAFPPVTLVGGICYVASSIIGIYGVEALNKVHERYVYARDRRLYTIIPLQKFSEELQESDISTIIPRCEKIITRYETIKEDSGGFFNYLKNQDAILKRLSKGCCHGAVATLFHDIEKSGLSIEQSALNMKKEDIYFRQLICQDSAYRLKILYLSCKQCIEEKEKEIKQCTDSLSESESFSSSMLLMENGSHRKLRQLNQSLSFFKQKIKEIEKETIHLKVIDPLHLPILKSQEFSPKQSLECYRFIFQSMLKSIPKDALIRGKVQLPEHTSGFQLVPKEYYIYDTNSSRSGGLLKFPNQDLFFKKLHSLVQEYTNLYSEYQELKHKLNPAKKKKPQNHKISFAIIHVHNANKT